MLNAYLPILVLIGVSTFIAVAAVVLGILMGPKRPSSVKADTYESGMKPIGPGTRRMPVKFYLVAVSFIIFDIEVIFMLPWAVVFKQIGLPGFLAMSVFLLVLTIGLVYEWQSGALQWD